MEFDQEKYPVPSMQGGQFGGASVVGMPTIKQRLDMAVRAAEERLSAVKRAKEILDKNPELEELLNIMQKSHF